MTRSIPMASTPQRRGFTLIELLVVVAIIAVLISILLPSLNRAREQGKTVKCLANLKTIGGVMYMYFADNNGWFPFAAKNHKNEPLHGFYYGGHPGRPGWWGYNNLEYRDTPAGRPFNRYLWNDLPKYDVPQSDPLFETVRKQMTVFECPSDLGAVYNSDGSYDPNAVKTTYWQCGSSFDLNYYFTWNWAYPKDKSRYLQRANAFLRAQASIEAASFIMLFEDPFDSSFWSKVPRRGWHKMMNRHNMLFLDGHAAATLAVTYDATERTLMARGPGWKLAGAHTRAANYAWWNNSQDGDYRFKDIAPVP